MFNILNYFKKLEKYQTIVDNITKSKNSGLYNSSLNIQKLITIELFKKTNKTIVLVYPNIYEATLAYEDYLELTEADKISFFPIEELVASEIIASSDNYKLERINTLFKILNNIPQIIITTPEGLSRNVVNKEKLNNAIIKIKKGNIYNRDLLIKSLITLGYQKVFFVENPGTYSVRGSVIDIYSINMDKPIRLDFFDDEIDEIKLFDISTQRSIEKIDTIDIYPYYDIIYFDNEIEDIKNRIKNSQGINERTLKVIDKIENHNDLDLLYLYMSYIDPLCQPIMDLISDKYLIFNNLHKILEKEIQNYNELYQYITDNNILLNMDFFHKTLDFIYNNSKNVFFESFSALLDNIDCDYECDLQTSNNIDYSNYLMHMIEETSLNKDKTYIVTHFDSVKLKLIKDLLENNNIEYIYCYNENEIKNKKINLVVSENALGFIDYELNTEIITPKQFAKGKIFKVSKYKQLNDKVVQVYNKEDLSIGDYVVHQDYGIGCRSGHPLFAERRPHRPAALCL